jgi:hypothetical protein
LRVSDVALGVLLAASLAANALLITRPRTGAVGAGSPSPTAARPEPPPLLRQAGVAAAAAPPDFPSCHERVASLEAQLAVMERKIERNRSLFDVFERATPDPAVSAQFGAELRQHLTGDGGTPPPVAVQCRGRICCITAEPDAGAMASLHSFEETLARRDRVRGGLSWKSPSQACLHLRSPDDPPEGIDLLRAAVTAFRKSGAIERCQTTFEDEGTLETRINVVSDEDDLEDEPLGLTLRVGGRLAGTPLGDCIAAALRRALDAVKLPPRYETAVVFARFPKK